jgi:hypothetical protein
MPSYFTHLLRLIFYHVFFSFLLVQIKIKKDPENDDTIHIRIRAKAVVHTYFLYNRAPAWLDSRKLHEEIVMEPRDIPSASFSPVKSRSLLKKSKRKNKRL